MSRRLVNRNRHRHPEKKSIIRFSFQVPCDCDTEEKGWLNCAEKVHRSPAERERRVINQLINFRCKVTHCRCRFDNYMQQDAHEFLNFLINHINEIILAERNQGKAKTTPNGSGVTVNENTSTNSSSNASSEPTWVHEIFQGVLTSETRCLNCETISSKDENFFDLQVDVDQNTSITHCLRCFSNTETLCSDNKFKCDTCSTYSEALKRMRVKKLPMILALQLKRFKYVEQVIFTSCNL